MYKTESTKKAIEGESSQAKGKCTSQSSRSRDIKCFKCLGIGHMASQCPNKKVVIFKDNQELESENEEDNESMPSLEYVSDKGVGYPIEGESLVVRFALNTQIKQDETNK